MQLQAHIQLFVTNKLAECRDFYDRQLGFQVVFQATWFVYMVSAGHNPYGPAFNLRIILLSRPAPKHLADKGMFLTLHVAEAASEFERLNKAGVPIAYPLRDEPSGQGRFGLNDPAGMWVDVVQQIEPEPGFWAKYME